MSAERKCIWCGGVLVKLEFHASSYGCPAGSTVPVESRKNAHLHVTCSTCGYEWTEEQPAENKSEAFIEGAERSMLRNLVAALRHAADESYCRAIENGIHDTLLQGVDVKLKTKVFGEKELLAHRENAKLLGLHYGVYQVLRNLGICGAGVNGGENINSDSPVH